LAPVQWLFNQAAHAAVSGGFFRLASLSEKLRRQKKSLGYLHRTFGSVATGPPDSFPGWAEAGRGVVAVADAALHRRILREAERLMRASPEIVETQGIGADTTTRIKRGLQ
jgi:hypothetical protein